MGGYCFLSAVRTLGTSLWTIKSNFDFFVLSVAVLWLSLFAWVAFLFSTSDMMFDLCWSWMWQDSVWEEEGWADPHQVCADLDQPRLGSRDRKVQVQQPRYNRGSWSFWTNTCQEWCFFTLLHCPQGIIFCSLCLNSFTLWNSFETCSPHSFLQYCAA